MASYSFDRAARAYADSLVKGLKKKKLTPKHVRLFLYQTALTPWKAFVYLGQDGEDAAVEDADETIAVTHAQRAIPPTIDETDPWLDKFCAEHGVDLAWSDLGGGLLCGLYYRELLVALRETKLPCAVWDEDKCGFDTTEKPTQYDAQIKKELKDLQLQPAALEQLAAMCFEDPARRAALVATAPKAKPNASGKPRWTEFHLMKPRKGKATASFVLSRTGRMLEISDSLSSGILLTEFTTDAKLVAHAEDFITARIRDGYCISCTTDPAAAVAVGRAGEKATGMMLRVVVDKTDVTAAVERWASGTKEQRDFVGELLKLHRNWIQHTPPIVEVAGSSWVRIRANQFEFADHGKLDVPRPMLAALVKEGTPAKAVKKQLGARFKLGGGKSMTIGYGR